jgi:hypothetical protein
MNRTIDLPSPPAPPAPAPVSTAAAAPRTALARLHALLNAVLEWPVSPRGLAVLFLLLFAGLSVSSWLRPPLSPDLSGANLPVRLGVGVPPPEDVLFAPRRPAPATLGGALLLLVAAGLALVLWRPRRVGLVAGVLLCAALVANAVLVFNSPALIELLDVEQEQRPHMVNVLHTRTDAPPLADKRNDRSRGIPRLDGVVSAAPRQDQEWGGLFRGWGYVLYAPYLIWVAAAGVLLGTPGSLARRLGWLTFWGVAGFTLAGAAVSQRVRAEYHWDQARQREARCDYAGARRELAEAVALFPEFGRMHRTWLLAGKLDYRERRVTPEQRFFLAFQYGRHNDWTQSLDLLGQAQLGSQHENPAVRQQAARSELGLGLRHFLTRDWAAAHDRCEQAALINPERRDCRLVLALIQHRLDPTNPERVKDLLAPFLDASRNGDRTLRADSLGAVGDAYFEAGHLPAARRWYAESLDVFQMPRSINFRSQKGLGGL